MPFASDVEVKGASVTPVGGVAAHVTVTP